jgi:nitroreductase
MHVHDAIMTRRSIRRFTPEAVPRTTLERILTAAARSPSGHNTQPWKVYAVAGDARQRLVDDMLNVVRTEAWEQRKPEYDYYPTTWIDPFLARKRKLGLDLYKTVGIARDDMKAREAQMHENFKFFGAPVGLFITFDRRMATGSFMDVGMFLEAIMIGARGEGLHTCGQAIFTWVHDVVRRHLPIPPEEILACGMALGHADLTAAENTLVVDKLPVSAFASFHGFEDKPA